MTDLPHPANYQAEKERAARLSILASGGLSVLKLVAGLLSGSLALLSEAAHGLIDFGSTIMTWFAIKASARPADEQHHYGHGKIEAVAALIETGLLIILAGIVAVEAVKRLATQSLDGLEATGIAIAVITLSICVDFVRWRHLKRIAALSNSRALASNALHFSSDILSSCAVLCGLLAVHFGFIRGDSIATLAVSTVIAIAGWRLGRETISTLLDAAPEGAVDKIRAALEHVRGIAEIPSVRVRSLGPTLYAEVSVLVPRTLPLERVSAIKAEALRAICEALPGAEATVTAEPVSFNDETILERVLLIAAKRRIPVHHVTVQELSGRLSISFDIEVDGRMSLAAAHHIASRLEASIRDEFGNDTEVETHIEPLEAQGLRGHDADASTTARISGIIEKLEGQIDGIGDVHSIRVRTTERGLVVSLHVLAEADKNVEDVHSAVDQLEQLVRQACPEVMRIVSHAEPKSQKRTTYASEHIDTAKGL